MFPCTVAHGNSGGFLSSSSTTILLSESLKRDSSIEKSAERWEVGGQVGQDKEHSTSFSQGACQSTLCSKLYILSNYFKTQKNLVSQGLSLSSFKYQTFGFEQTIWVDKFWGFWNIFIKIFSTHFGTVSPLSMFSINQTLFLQETKPLYPNSKNLFGIGIWIWTTKNPGFSHRVSLVYVVAFCF